MEVRKAYAKRFWKLYSQNLFHDWIDKEAQGGIMKRCALLWKCGIWFLKIQKNEEECLGVTFRFRREILMMVGISKESDQIIGIWNSFTQIQYRNIRLSWQKLQCQEKMTKDK